MVLEDYIYDIEMCVRCSLCKWVNPWDVKSARFAKICPSNAKFLWDAYLAQGRMDISKGLLKKGTRKILYESPKLAEIVFACMLCGGCDINCKRNRDLEILEVLKELRFRLVEDGIGPMPKHLAFGESVEKNHNPYNEPHQQRLDWLPRGSHVPDKAEIIYFVGCTSSYRELEIARATFNILKAAKVDFGIMHPNEWCCGSPLMRTGQKSLALQLIEHNVESIENTGAKKVLTSCAGCYSMLKTEYPKYADINFEIIHSIELVKELLDQGKLDLVPKKAPVKVTYHDPCHLGRLSEPYIPWEGKRIEYGELVPPKDFRRGTHGVYEPPRTVINKIPSLELVEMERIKEYAWCCGAGGGVRSAFQDFSLWVSSERIEEAMQTDAELLLTCCPFCKRNLKDAASNMQGKLEVLDIVEIIADSLGGRE